MLRKLESVSAELDTWQSEGRSATFWWRDDDVVSDSSELQRLFDIARRTRAVVALAVIPNDMDDGLPDALRNQPCVAWQHGYRHLWRLDDDERGFEQGEFGPGRALESMMADAVSGWRAMDRVFGEQWEPVFVPPFHALAPEFKAVIPSLGYRGLSSGLPFIEPIPTLAEVSAEVDIMDWPNRRFLGNAAAADLVSEQLRARRSGDKGSEPIGILTHHLAMDAGAWDFTEALFSLLDHHEAAELIPANRVFDQSLTIQSDAESQTEAINPDDGEITVVITSCGRQDLLERTIDSFLRFNSHPVKEIVVVEDGEGDRNAELAKKFQAYPFRWHATGQRVGQIATIDTAYRLVQTEFVFHCEDDWEFLAPGFMEKSKVLLEGNPSLLQVWLRGLSDTNRHPLVDFPLRCNGVEYRLLHHFHDAGDWGIWHGLSWNPGLRRMRDYHLLGGFGSLDPEGIKQTWRVECEAGAFYQQRGMFAAILADRGNDGYVRHIGVGRRVPRDYLPTNSTSCL